VNKLDSNAAEQLHNDLRAIRTLFKAIEERLDRIEAQLAQTVKRISRDPGRAG